MNEPERRLEDLLATAQRPDVSEADIRADVRALFNALIGGDVARQEVSVAGGSIDVLVLSNVIVETKKDVAFLGIAPNYVLPERRRDYAATQLQDYVNARYKGLSDSKNFYSGFTTNGIVWYRWEVSVGEDTPTQNGRYDLNEIHLQGVELHGRTSSEIVSDFLSVLHEATQTRPPPPQDLSQLLADFPLRAEQIAHGAIGSSEFETKRLLWDDLMRGAFIVKPDDETKNIRLFSDHSLLLEIARRVVWNLTRMDEERLTNDETVFSSWLSDSTSTLSPDIDALRRDLIWNLHREIDRYDWRLSSIDILKDIYHSFIPSDVRHDFGEYYTPDWLADAVCEYVMDDAWCRESVARSADPEDDLHGVGVLEPACGSGTFLRAAVNRLIPFAEDVTSDEVEQANIICRLVHGLDIHPVAVELSRATMLAALPAMPTRGEAALNIFLTDSLRWVLTTDMRIVDQGGLLIEVPKDNAGQERFIQIPPSAVNISRFGELIDDLMFYSGDEEVLEVRMQNYGFDPTDKKLLIKSASVLADLKRENRNHVWIWYIKNVAQAHRFNAKKFARMVGNPPWITRRDLDKARQDLHREESMKLGIWVGGATYATQNNYAALFSATVIRDYMVNESSWNVGLVMPWSALKSKVWGLFKKGDWSKEEPSTGQDEWYCDLSAPPWDLRNITRPPFEQSHSCVIFVRNPTSSTPVEMSNQVEEWRGESIDRTSVWRDVRSKVQRTIRMNPPESPSVYVESIRNGATIFPYGLVRVSHDGHRSGGRGVTRFTTMMSSQGAWRGYQQNGEVEEECVRQVIFSTDVGPYRVFIKSYGILPPLDVLSSMNPEIEVARYRLFGRYWAESARIWKQRRLRNSPATLSRRVDHLGQLSYQLRSESKFRLVYPSSGSWMFGVKVPGATVVEHKCYYMNIECEAEADYLCAVLSAEALQDAYRDSKHSPLDFGTYPLRSVPIPKFDTSNDVHVKLSELGSRAEDVSAQVPLRGKAQMMRPAIRVALRDDGVSGEIDRCVRELLPGYASS